MKPIAVDTNIPVVANGGAGSASLVCQKACVEFLQEVVARGRVVVDAGGCIMREYQKYLSFRGAPGVGDAFFRHVFNNQANPTRVIQAPIVPTTSNCLEFTGVGWPQGLEKFDPSDRKFLLAALAVGGSVANATDSDWKEHAVAIKAAGVQVIELCE